MVSLIAGSASPTRLLFFRYIDGIYLMSFHATLVGGKDNLAGWGTPTAPATLATESAGLRPPYEGNPDGFPHRRVGFADAAALFRYIDGTFHATLVGGKDNLAAGGTPTASATLATAH